MARPDPKESPLPHRKSSLSPFLETIAMYVSDMLTAPANLAGIPAISIPVGLSQKELSLGIQVMGIFFKNLHYLCLLFYWKKK
jgi:aspartyl-tRNA(Asn)/glutamyl-tRNA(Gln) amidotransferase subunit A